MTNIKKFLKYSSFLVITLCFSIIKANASIVSTTYQDSKEYLFDTTETYSFEYDGHTFTYETTGDYTATISMDGVTQNISTTRQDSLQWLVWRNNTTGKYEFYANGPTAQGTSGSKTYINNYTNNSNGCEPNIQADYVEKGNCNYFSGLMESSWKTYYKYDTNTQTWTGNTLNTSDLQYYFYYISENNDLRIFGGNISVGTYVNTWPQPSLQNLNWYNFESGSGPSPIIFLDKYEVYYSQQIQSLDLYFINSTQNEKYQIEIESTNFTQANYTPSYYRFYGEKCNTTNGVTCWWEQISNNNSSITNDTYTYENNKIIIEFDLTIDTSNYNFIKVAIGVLPNMFDLTIRNTNNTNFSIDLNNIGSEYNLISYNVMDELKALYIDSKSNDINYRYYIKRPLEYDTISSYYYDKQNNIIENSIDSTIFKQGYYEIDTQPFYGGVEATYNNSLGQYTELGNYYIETGLIQLGPNKRYALYIASEIFNRDRYSQHNIYVNDKVYYGYTNDFTLKIEYGNTHIDTTYNVTNEYLASAFENVSDVNFESIKDIINEYEEYKDQWLAIFNSIYDPMPNVIKHILVVIYFMACSYGIFLIFKD